MPFDVIAIRLSKVILIGGLGVWAFFAVLGNVTDYDANWAFVQHVLSMDSIFPDSPLMWRAITDPTLQTIAYLIIMFFEALTSISFLIAAWMMAKALKAPKAKFKRAKAFVALGALFGVGLWMIGFMAIGGEWFVMWQSGQWNGQQAAFMFYMSILAVVIYVFLDTDGEPAAEP
ncbi:MAG: DUF2165 domain-containing protein [Pseudomonadota bacterium]